MNEITNLYDQCYYYGKMGEGLKIQKYSGNDVIRFKGIQGKKYSFKDIITEYVEYSGDRFLYTGSKYIDMRDNNGRYNEMSHIIMHTEADDINDPRSYIRYCANHYYKGEFEPTNSLESIEIYPLKSSCREIAEQFLLNGEKNLKKLAKLLELFYDNILFGNNALVDVLNEDCFGYDENKPNCYFLAAELMLFLHMIVPDCFSSYNSIDKLRKRVKYCVTDSAEGNYGRVCFVPKNSAVESKKIAVFDYNNDYSDVDENSFYYALAKALQSDLEIDDISEQDKMKNMNDFLMSLSPDGEKFGSRQENLRHLALKNIISCFENFKKSNIFDNANELISWEKSDISGCLRGNSDGYDTRILSYIRHLIRFRSQGGTEQIPRDAIMSVYKTIIRSDAGNPEKLIFLMDCSSADDELKIKMLRESLGNDSFLDQYYQKEGNYISILVAKAALSLKDLRTLYELFKTPLSGNSSFANRLKGQLSEIAEALLRNNYEWKELSSIYTYCCDNDIIDSGRAESVLSNKVYSLNDPFDGFDSFKSSAQNNDRIFNRLIYKLFCLRFTEKLEFYNSQNDSEKYSKKDEIDKIIAYCEQISPNIADDGTLKRQQIAIDELEVFFTKSEIDRYSSFKELYDQFKNRLYSLKESVRNYFFTYAVNFTNCIPSAEEYRALVECRNEFSDKSCAQVFCKKVSEIAHMILNEVNDGDYTHLFLLDIYNEREVFISAWKKIKCEDFGIINNICEAEQISSSFYFLEYGILENDISDRDAYMAYTLFLIYYMLLSCSSENNGLSSNSIINCINYSKWEKSAEYEYVKSFLLLPEILNFCKSGGQKYYFSLANNISDRHMIHRDLYPMFCDNLDAVRGFDDIDVIRKLINYSDILKIIDRSNTNEKQVKEFIKYIVPDNSNYLISEEERKNLKDSIISISQNYLDNRIGSEEYYIYCSEFPQLIVWLYNDFNKVYTFLQSVKKKYEFYTNVTKLLKDKKKMQDIVSDEVEGIESRKELYDYLNDLIAEKTISNNTAKDSFAFIIFLAAVKNVKENLISLKNNNQLEEFCKKDNACKEKFMDDFINDRKIYEKVKIKLPTIKDREVDPLINDLYDHFIEASILFDESKQKFDFSNIVKYKDDFVNHDKGHINNKSAKYYSHFIRKCIFQEKQNGLSLLKNSINNNDVFFEYGNEYVLNYFEWLLGEIKSRSSSENSDRLKKTFEFGRILYSQRPELISDLFKVFYQNETKYDETSQNPPEFWTKYKKFKTAYIIIYEDNSDFLYYNLDKCLREYNDNCLSYADKQKLNDILSKYAENHPEKSKVIYNVLANYSPDYSDDFDDFDDLLKMTDVQQETEPVTNSEKILPQKDNNKESYSSGSDFLSNNKKPFLLGDVKISVESTNLIDRSVSEEQSLSEEKKAFIWLIDNTDEYKKDHLQKAIDESIKDDAFLEEWLRHYKKLPKPFREFLLNNIKVLELDSQFLK